MGKRSAHAKKEQPSSSKKVGGFSHVKKGRLVWLSLLLLAILAAGTALIWPPKGGVPIFAPLAGDTRQVGCKQEGASLTTSDLLAMSDDDLERMSLIEMNLVGQTGQATKTDDLTYFNACGGNHDLYRNFLCSSFSFSSLCLRQSGRI